MKHLLLLTLISIVLSACVNTPIVSSLPENFSETSVVVIIKDPRPARRKQSTVSTGYRSKLNYDVDPILTQASQEIANDYKLKISYAWPIRTLDVHCFVVETNDPATLIKLLNSDSRVSYAQSLNSFSGSNSNPKGKKFKSRAKSTEVTDVYHSENQYGQGQRIAIIDTLADINHPDLIKSNITQWDLLGNSRGQKQERHGTAVLGLIAAQHSNGIGIDGAAPKAKVGLFRGCWQLSKDAIEATCDTVALSLALDAALRWNPDVINLSLTGPPDRLLEEFISRMINNGVIVVAAFDEKRGEKNRFPTKRPGVIFAYGQNQSTNPTPNTDIVSISQKDAFTLQPGGNYDVLSGHSMAAPIVSSVIALFKESKPNASSKTIFKKLKSLESELVTLK